MRDYAELVKALNEISNKTSCYYCHGESLDCKTAGCYISDAADAIEELLAVCRDIAAFVIQYADDDEAIAEVLCRKLHKIGLIEKDGAWWALPEPPKEETE